MKTRSLLALAFMLAAVMVLVVRGDSARADHPEKVGPPNSITVIGDSISQGFSTQFLGESPENNWATGTNSSVNSHYLRILAMNPGIAGNNFNHSVSGARMVHAPGQAQNVVASGAEFVLVEMGGNDVCTSNVGNMTPVATYRAQFEETMEILTQGLPDARIFVASVPNVWYLWEAGRTNLFARLIWALGSICQSLLAQPTCMTSACVDRRAQVSQRALDYSVQLDEVCQQYIHCRFDNYRVYNTPFTAAHVSSFDWFHPSIAGQALLAQGTWEESFDYTDLSAPVTTLTPDRPPDGIEGWYNNSVTVTLEAVDDEGVSGSEYFYQLQGSNGLTPWIPYTAPFTISAEGITDIHYRSVDVNGNIEEGQEAQIKIDRTPPTLNLTCPGTLTLGQTGTIVVSASDALSGFEVDPSGSFDFVATDLGTNLHEQTVADKAGNTTTESCSFEVHYAFSGVLQPINPDGSSVFKLRSTVSVRFQLSDHNGDSVDSAVATISVAKVLNAVIGDFEEAESTAAASTGNQFRYDEDDEQYVFNLGTRNLSVGTWVIKISLDDGTEHHVIIGLK